MNVFTLYYRCFLLLLVITVSLSEIIIVKNGTNKTIEVIEDIPARFGPPLPLGGLKGFVVYTDPADACSPPKPPPNVPRYRGPFIALVRRYNCTFVQKVLNAQNAGYHAVIVRNVGSNEIEPMNGDHNTDSVVIPSVFIGQDDGLMIQNNFQYDSGYYAVVTDDLPFNIQNYLLPFAITIGICFILMLTLMLLKCIRDYRHTRRNRLSYRALKKLPQHKFKKGDPYECCAVCLEDYVDNDRLRVLPCGHAYHSKCIDPWLTKNRRVCPVCKRKVITKDENPSDLESDSEDETAPLIPAESGTQGGTFSQQSENPFQEAERQAEQRRQEGEGRSEETGRNYSLLDEMSDSDSEEEDPCWQNRPNLRTTNDVGNLAECYSETSSSGSDNGEEEEDSPPAVVAATAASHPPPSTADSTVVVETRIGVEAPDNSKRPPPNDFIV